MLQIENNQTTPSPQTSQGLAATVDEWPREAFQAYRELLAELNRWSRQNDHPMSTNPSVAEEAVRQTWAEAA